MLFGVFGGSALFGFVVNGHFITEALMIDKSLYKMRVLLSILSFKLRMHNNILFLLTCVETADVDNADDYIKNKPSKYGSVDDKGNFKITYQQDENSILVDYDKAAIVSMGESIWH